MATHLLRNQADLRHIQAILGHAQITGSELYAISRRMVLATDDIAARRLAARRNVPLTGTLGLLIELVKQDVMTLERANVALSRMIEQGYRSPCERLEELI